MTQSTPLILLDDNVFSPNKEGEGDGSRYINRKVLLLHHFIINEKYMCHLFYYYGEIMYHSFYYMIWRNVCVICFIIFIF